MIYKITHDNELTLHLDTNEMLVFMDLCGQCSEDYTIDELKTILNGLVKSLELLVSPNES